VTYSLEEFKQHWVSTKSNGEAKGIAMFLETTPAFFTYKMEGEANLKEKRSFRFLFGYVKKYRKYFGQIILGLLVGKKKKSEIELKDMFQEKKYHKSYLAIVQGEIKEELKIDKALDREGKAIGVRMKVCTQEEGGKESITIIKPIIYDKEKNLTLVEALPLTGRQHQIRVHLHSMGHTILGDPIYGVDDENAENYLNKTLSKEDRFKVTKSHRLWLHANYLEFNYKDVTYKIFSKNRDLYKEFF
jgi:23S rRNA pseudouridine1911/1915/1917 synthase